MDTQILDDFIKFANTGGMIPPLGASNNMTSGLPVQSNLLQAPLMSGQPPIRVPNLQADLTQGTAPTAAPKPMTNTAKPLKLGL